jgi:hypothetical protein
MEFAVPVNASFRSKRGKDIKYEERSERIYPMRLDKPSSVVPGLSFWKCATQPIDPASGKHCGGRARKNTGSEDLQPDLMRDHWHPPPEDDKLVGDWTSCCRGYRSKSLLKARFIDNRVKEIAADDLTMPTKTVEDLATILLSPNQMQFPRMRRMDFRQKVYRRRFKGMKLKQVNRVPFASVILPEELTLTSDGRRFLLLDTKRSHPGRIIISCL